MARSLVRNIPDWLAKALKRRTSERGVSAEEEHRRILQKALAPESAKDGKRTLFDHIRELGEIAPDIELERERVPLAAEHLVEHAGEKE